MPIHQHASIGHEANELKHQSDKFYESFLMQSEVAHRCDTVPTAPNKNDSSFIRVSNNVTITTAGSIAANRRR